MLMLCRHDIIQELVILLEMICGEDTYANQETGTHLWIVLRLEVCIDNIYDCCGVFDQIGKCIRNAHSDFGIGMLQQFAVDWYSISNSIVCLFDPVQFYLHLCLILRIICILAEDAALMNGLI